MEIYEIECPICDDIVKIELADNEVIYFIEAYESNPRRIVSWMAPDPDEKVGRDLVIDQEWTRTVRKTCDNEHYIFCTVTQYDNVKHEEDRMYGPAEEPDVHCPACKSRFGGHEDYIFRFDKSMKMQYILRSVALSPSTTYTYTEGLTHSEAGKVNQLYEVHTCDHCGSDIYFNYSNRRVNKSEKYQGVS